MSDNDKNLHIWLFMHEDLDNMSIGDFERDYCKHVQDELTSFTDFKVRFNIRRSVDGISDIEYPEDNDVILHKVKQGWEARQWTYPGVNIFLLVTRRKLNDETLGVAWLKGRFGAASTETYRTLGHEIGHLLGATHEDGQIHYDGWWKESYTYPGGVLGGELRGNAYRYSDENRANIVKYLESAPRSPLSPRS